MCVDDHSRLAYVEVLADERVPTVVALAERFIQTLLREWAYAVPYHSSAERTAALPPWLHYYNWHRRTARSVPDLQSAEPSARTIC
jgi:transposase InsO family protein